jgi:biopolymer transport protein ExbD
MSVRPDHGDDVLAEVHEITPFIDVMLVLLIISMVAAPSATVDIVVNLPASTAQPQPDVPLFLTVKSDLTLVLGERPVPCQQTAQCARSGRPRRKRQGYLRARR